MRLRSFALAADLTVHTNHTFRPVILFARSQYRFTLELWSKAMMSVHSLTTRSSRMSGPASHSSRAALGTTRQGSPHIAALLAAHVSIVDVSPTTTRDHGYL